MKQFQKYIEMQLINMIKRMGYNIIPKWRESNYSLANHLRDLFLQTNVSCCIDVGANAGQYRDFLRYEVGYEGRIVSIEPDLDMISILHDRSVDDERWVIVEGAVGAIDHTAKFNIMANSQLSSLKRPIDAPHVGFRAASTINRTVSVEVRQLESIVKTIILDDDVIYLKLDTQGSELEILKGATSILNRVVALQCESAVIPLYDDAPNIIDVWNDLDNYGFDITGVFPVNRDEKLRVIDFDCVARSRNC